jgi:outer membrane protein OmpA-like peptidoglycan-associated protein/tetratricopeptide (TPR) repeat protein
MKLKMTIRLFTLLFATMWLGIDLSAQDKMEYVSTTSARESIQIAQKFINSGNFKQAKKQLMHTIVLKENFAVAHRELGRVCLELEEYESAADALEMSFSYDNNLSRAAYFECGEAYFYLENLAQALYYYKEYEGLKGSNYTNRKKEMGLEKVYDESVTRRKENIKYISEAKENPINIAPPVSLGATINSSDNEYLPATLSNGQRIVFTRDRRGHNENILTAVKDENNIWTTGRAFDEKMNTHSNEGMAKFSTDGRKFYFTGCKRPDTDGGCDIYEAKMSIFGEVTSVKHVKGINNKTWDSQPCISCNNDAIYFSSNRPGGFGGTDIYVSYRRVGGLWSDPVNLGPNVNTAKDEEAPFIGTDGKTLYFTSNGLPGFGDGDLFVTREIGNVWGTPINMGAPFNSPSKELGFFLQGDGKTAFFSSARPGGEGGLDLYEIELPDHFRSFPMNHVQGVIVNDETNQPISTHFVIRRIGERYPYESDRLGEFFTCLKQGKAYTFHIEVDGYQEFMSAVYLPKSDNSKPTFVEIRMIPLNKTPKPVTVASKPPINRQRKIVKRVFFYFDINSSDLNVQTESKLDDLVNTIKFDDKWNIEVIGYADSSGDAVYNKVLSEKRANSISGYLKNSGIVIDKVSQEGRGSIEGKTEEEKKKSRRVEVILRGVLEDTK